MQSSGRKPSWFKREINKEGIKKVALWQIKLKGFNLIRKRERCEFNLQIANYEFW